MRTLYELCGAERDVRFSPTVWRTRMQLKHKGLDFIGEPTRFLEKEPFAPSGSKTVPVLKDGETWVADSFKIALYLDETYPDNPLIAGGDAGIAAAEFFNNWALTSVLSQLFPMIAADIIQILDDENAAYFRETREKALGQSLEDAQVMARPNLPVLRGSLVPARMALKKRQFLSGDQPGFNDYCLFGIFMWSRVVSTLEVLSPDDPLSAWMDRMLDLFDGYARSAKLGV